MDFSPWLDPWWWITRITWWVSGYAFCYLTKVVLSRKDR